MLGTVNEISGLASLSSLDTDWALESLGGACTPQGISFFPWEVAATWRHWIYPMSPHYHGTLGMLYLFSSGPEPPPPHLSCFAGLPTVKALETEGHCV